MNNYITKQAGILPLLLMLLLGSCTNDTPVDLSDEVKENTPLMVHADGTYDVLPLEKDELVLKLIQNDVKTADNVEDAKQVFAENLEHVKDMIIESCTTGEKPNMILLHEFPLTGYVYGGRQEKLQMSFNIPGKESDALCELAKKYDTYIIYGCYAVDADWPGHILSLTTIIDRNGAIVKKVWKPRNIKRFYSSFEITTTTVESVREKFIEKYGAEEAFPIIKTEFGNIAVSTAQLDPLVFMAFSMKGAEIILRTSTYFFEADVIATAMYNNVYSAMSNIPADSKYGGNSMVVSPDGEVVGRLENNSEGILTAKIPIADFRKNRKLPQYSVALTKQIFDQYKEEIPMNHLDMPAAELPENGKEMKAHLDSLSYWLH